MKNALYYLLLVGGPFLGLLAILQAGSRIVPPRSIGGVWDVELEAANGTAPSCPGLTFDTGTREMRVSQSGLRAHVVLSDRAGTSFSIEVRGDSVSGLLSGSEQRSCTRATELQAQIRTDEGRETLEGELRALECTDCPVLALRATRRPGAVRE